MTVYVDDMRLSARVGNLQARWSHLMADTTEELLEVALRLGMRPAWIQYPGTPKEHFDLTDPKRQLALRLGARSIRYGHEGAALMKAKREGRVFDLDGHRAAQPEVEGAGEQLDLF